MAMDRSLQDLVWRRAGHRCEDCRVPQDSDRLPFEIDHNIAEIHNGPTRADNLCLCCFAGNRHKETNIAGIDPRTGRIVPFFHPRRQKWARHFRWDGPHLRGRSPGAAPLSAF